MIIFKCKPLSDFKLSYIMHTKDENIMLNENEIRLGYVNKFTEEIYQRGSRNTTEWYWMKGYNWDFKNSPMVVRNLTG